jgi:glycosyltransferase involved in cell wall biosynthesis
MIQKNAKKECVNIMVISTLDVHEMVFHYLLARIFAYTLVMNYVEYSPAVCKKNSIKDTLNRVLFEKYAVNAVDGILAISDFLLLTAKRIKPQAKVLKIPVMCDFNKFEEEQVRTESSYFLYCGSTAYIDVCKFVLRSFDLLHNQSINLHLVLNGPESELSRCRQLIQGIRRCAHVKMFTNLPYSDLVRQYKNATGLLIPLRPNEQDRARFPHKIGEYTASRKPIITTDIGEIPRYFKDGQSAYIAQGYDQRNYAEQMQKVLSDPSSARRIADAAWRVGYENFHYQQHIASLSSFMLSLQGD